MLTYALLAGGVLLVAAVSLWEAQRRKRAAFLAAVRAGWGKAMPLRRRDPQAIAGLREALAGGAGVGGDAAAGDLRLDDAAWGDLDLDAVFEQLDRTLTEPGQQVLHELSPSARS